MKKGSIKRRKRKGMSSFRKQIYNSFQNVRFKRRENKSIRTDPRKRSPKEYVAPQPPNITNVQNKEASSLQEVENNVYVPCPKQLPPKPVPRQSKMRQPDPDSEEDDNQKEANL